LFLYVLMFYIFLHYAVPTFCLGGAERLQYLLPWAPEGNQPLAAPRPGPQGCPFQRSTGKVYSTGVQILYRLTWSTVQSIGIVINVREYAKRFFVFFPGHQEGGGEGFRGGF
jgi:hypothetical protein